MYIIFIYFYFISCIERKNSEIIANIFRIVLLKNVTAKDQLSDVFSQNKKKSQNGELN